MIMIMIMVMIMVMMIMVTEITGILYQILCQHRSAICNVSRWAISYIIKIRPAKGGLKKI